MSSPEHLGKVLRAAREAWELSHEEVALLAELDVEEVSLAEQGDADVSTITAIATSLGGRLDDVMGGRRFWEAPSVALRSSAIGSSLDVVRRALLRLSLAAKDLRDVQALLGVDVAPPPALLPEAVSGVPAVQAELLASRVRTTLGAGMEPIASVRAILDRLGFGTFLTSIGSSEIDGLSWRDADGRGFAAANVDARSAKVTAVRITFAHELCHLLFDGTRGEPLAMIDRRDDEHGTGLEQRANAFGAYFLAPRDAVFELLRRHGWSAGAKPTAQHVIAVSKAFGLGVEATAWHFVNCRLWSRDDVKQHRHLRTEMVGGEDTRELQPTDAEAFVPLERRGALLDLATTAVEKQLVSVGKWRELVGLSPEVDWRKLWVEREVDADGEHRTLL